VIPEWFKTLAFITMGSIMVVFLMCIVAFIVVAIVTVFQDGRENKNRRLK
jgi:hypothetical protein